MERLTKRTDDGRHELAGAGEEAALQRLALYENMHEGVLQSQQETAARLEELRSRGREKTVQFREQLAQKLTNGQVLALLKVYGLE